MKNFSGSSVVLEHCAYGLTYCHKGREFKSLPEKSIPRHFWTADGFVICFAFWRVIRVAITFWACDKVKGVMHEPR